MSDNSVDPNNINWKIHDNKRVNDLELYRVIGENIYKSKNISMLTLPADKWIFEYNLISSHENIVFDITGLERNKNVFIKSRRKMYALRKELPNNKFKLLNKSVLDYISDKHQYNIVYTDWMGTWSKEKEAEVYKMFDNNIFKKNSLLVFTIMLSRGQPQTLNELKELSEINTISFPFHEHRSGENFAAKTRGLTNKIHLIGKEYGRYVDILYFGEYQGKTQPELSFAFIVK